MTGTRQLKNLKGNDWRGETGKLDDFRGKKLCAGLRLVSQLVGALSPVNHKGLYLGSAELRRERLEGGVMGGSGRRVECDGVGEGVYWIKKGVVIFLYL